MFSVCSVELNGVSFCAFCNIDFTWEGWTAYGVLMVVHLLTDGTLILRASFQTIGAHLRTFPICTLVVNGSKLIVLSGKGRNPSWQRIRFFLGGLFLVAAALITLYASTVYNNAIATSNRYGMNVN